MYLQFENLRTNEEECLWWHDQLSKTTASCFSFFREKSLFCLVCTIAIYQESKKSYMFLRTLDGVGRKRTGVRKGRSHTLALAGWPRARTLHQLHAEINRIKQCTSARITHRAQNTRYFINIITLTIYTNPHSSWETGSYRQIGKESLDQWLIEIKYIVEELSETLK